jgi:hypothetical protein
MNLIGFDFDSIIVDMGLALCCVLTEHLRYQVTLEHIKHYTIEYNFPGMTKEEAKHIIDKALSIENALNIPPIDGALDFIKFYAKKYPIYIVTNRTDLRPVDIYLQYNMDYNTYNKTKIFSSCEKGILCKELGITHFVDDHIRNIIDLANNGIVPIMLLCNWNKNVFTGRETITQLIRFISNWEDLYRIVHCEMENMV